MRANLAQLTVLSVLIGLTGGMVGMERAVLPLLAEREFSLASKAAILSFIISYGILKAPANLCGGWLSDRFSRKRILIIGWLFGLPVPLLVAAGPSWGWVVFANVLLGVNQGFCWSVVVIMIIDLVGPANRGLGTGLSEAPGYFVMSLAAAASGYLAGAYGLRSSILYLGTTFAVAGLALSVFFVRESVTHAHFEASLPVGPQLENKIRQPERPSLAQVVLLTSWKNRALFSVSQAGMFNNLNDGMAWGLFPLWFAAAGATIQPIGLLAAVYPAVWGIAQTTTGVLSDRFGRKWVITVGMWIQGIGILMVAATHRTTVWILGSALLGFGTALVNPAFLAVIGDVARPNWRATSVGVYRLWRDGGYALGALLTGVVADLFGLRWAIGAVGMLTLLSGSGVAVLMPETLPHGRLPASSREMDDAAT